jgi:hypothetical protein
MTEPERRHGGVAGVEWLSIGLPSQSSGDVEERQIGAMATLRRDDQRCGRSKSRRRRGAAGQSGGDAEAQ